MNTARRLKGFAFSLITGGAAWALGAAAVVTVATPGAVLAADATEQVTQALSGYHSSATAAQLESIAGGAGNLVPILLALRTQEKPPFVAIRAEKLLLGYSNVPEVRAALEQDLQSPQLMGLARVISMHIDTVSDADVRQGLAKLAVARAAQDGEFLPYAKALTQSRHADIRETAKTLAK